MGMRRVILVFVAATLLVGCGRTQMHDAADLKAGAIAFQNAEAQGMTPEQLLEIARGLASYARAVLDGMALPAPTMEPAEIIADPAAYADDAADAQADPEPVTLHAVGAEANGASAAPGAGVFDRFAHYGGLLLDSGIVLGGLGLIVLVIVWVVQKAKWMPTGILGGICWFLEIIGAPLARLAALWGAASTAVGAALVWLAAYWWAVVLVILAAGGYVVWDHWKTITSWWRKRHVLPRQTADHPGRDHA